MAHRLTRTRRRILVGLTGMRRGALHRVMAVVLCIAVLFGLFGTSAKPVHADTGSNWTGAYYSNPNLQGTPVFTRIDPAVVFNWGPNPPGPGLGSQNWSARWLTVQYFNAGTYRFNVTSDDGVRVFIDGQLILDRWVNQAPTTYFVNVQLTAGNHAIQVDYYQGVGDASISVSWDFIFAPSTAWTAQYFNNPSLAGAPVLTRAEQQIAYNWGIGSPDPLVPPDNFSARWTATLPFNAGTYRFTLTSDDGIRMFVDNLLVVDQWRLQALTTFSIDVNLSAGLHTIRIEYFEGSNIASVSVNFSTAVGPPPFPGSQSDQWYGEYYNNPTLSGSPVFLRYDGRSGINFNWTGQSPAPGVQPNQFSVRWTRQVCVPGRPYIFYISVDDGVRFYIDQTLIVDSWREQSRTTIRQPVDLTAGCHLFRVEYFQANYESLIQLTWDPPDGQNPPLYVGGTQPPPTGNVVAVVNTSLLNVRTGPGVNFEAFTRVARGDRLVLSARNADSTWLRATTPNGSIGWVSAPFVVFSSGNASLLPVTGGVPGVPGSTGTRGRVSTALRLRAGPGTNFPIQTVITAGVILDIVGRSSNGQWLQVRYGAVTGWVYAPYVLVVSGNLGSVPITA
jgi:uncharacterized protein YraI